VIDGAWGIGAINTNLFPIAYYLLPITYCLLPSFTKAVDLLCLQAIADR
jgi:hypothetical protein